MRLEPATAAAGTTLRSRLAAADLLRLGGVGLRVRPMRAVLSALGIAIGIAAMVAVISISASGRERLNAQLSAFGTNLLTAQPAEAAFGESLPMPADAVAKVERIDGVESASATGLLEGTHVYRSSLIEAGLTGGISVEAADLGLLGVVGGSVAKGTWLNPATARYPTAVLGSEAARRLGVTAPGALVWLGGEDVTVVGIMRPVGLAPELDSDALVGIPFAAGALGFDRHPTKVYERSGDAEVEDVRALLAPTVQPSSAASVEVSRPSEVLAAKQAADDAFSGLLLALGSVGLLVGGIGVANTMVISVLERRREIGLRRALGATRRHIWLQFLVEALLLSMLGGAAGAGLGAAVTTAVATANGWTPVIPVAVLAAGIGLTTLIGGLAGLYPAIRAARTPPSAALVG
jgi:putative ABC transport system permease protein